MLPLTLRRKKVLSQNPSGGMSLNARPFSVVPLGNSGTKNRAIPGCQGHCRSAGKQMRRRFQPKIS
jgi:hypothetical protein